MLLQRIYLTATKLKSITRIVNLVESNPSVQLQNYSRFAPRKPVKIVNEDDLFDVDTKNTFYKSPKAIKKPKSAKSNLESSEKYKQKSLSEELNFDEVYEYKPPQKSATKNKNSDKYQHKSIERTESNHITKLYDNEKLISSYIMDLRSKKRRKKNEEILLEGKLHIKDAIEAGLKPKFIVYSRLGDVQEFLNSGIQTKFYKVPYRTIQLWSTLTTSPGIMAIFEKPLPRRISKSSLPLTIICDNVRDPGNMGTILRAAAGVGCEKIILTKGCVDFWDVKVLRSAAGAHFRVPIFGSQEWAEINKQLSNDAHVFIADNNAECQEEIADDQVSEETDEGLKKLSIKDQMETNYLREEVRNLPVVPYYAVDYTKNQVVLIVGGETQGLSRGSLSLAQNRQGVRVNIPLDNKLDSLNAGMALGIVAFEVKRQFLLIARKLNQLAQ